MEKPDPKKVSEEFLKSKNVEGEIIFAMIGGSHCYNLNIETSDFDYIAIYAAKPSSLLGLPSKSSPPVVQNTKQDKIDIAIYEVSKFCETLLTGSPVMIQCLYTNNFFFETKEFSELKKNSKLFLCSQTIRAYFGHVKSEIKQTNSKDWSKNLYHAFRLIFEIERMLDGKEPKIFWENEEREFLLNVRNEKKSKNEYLFEIKKKMESIEKIEKKLNDYFKVDIVKRGMGIVFIINLLN
eukprot:gene1009-9915_t